MLLSMTGYGEARRTLPHVTVDVEVRTVNNRHFKLTTRLGDVYAALEPEIDKLARGKIKRGSLHVSVRVERAPRQEDFRLNLPAINSYQHQLTEIFGRAIDPGVLLTLPGVIAEPARDADLGRDDRPLVLEAVAAALDRLHAARAEEGRAMAAELAVFVGRFDVALDAVAIAAPCVVTAYQARLLERVRTLLADTPRRSSRATWRARSRFWPNAPTSPKKSFASARTSRGFATSSTRATPRAARSNSSCRKWAAKRTRSAPKPMMSISPNLLST